MTIKWQTKTCGHGWQSRCTVKKCQSRGQTKWTLSSVLVPEKMSWVTATRSIRKCKPRIEKIWGSCVDTEPNAWVLDVQVWNLLWTGEEAMKKGIPIFKKAGFESVEDLPRTAVGFSHHSSGCLQRRMVSKEFECIGYTHSDSLLTFRRCRHPELWWQILICV